MSQVLKEQKTVNDLVAALDRLTVAVNALAVQFVYRQYPLQQHYPYPQLPQMQPYFTCGIGGQNQQISHAQGVSGQ